MSLYKRCFGRLVIKGQFTRKTRARAWAKVHFGQYAKEGFDFVLVQAGNGNWAAEPGPRYDNGQYDHVTEKEVLGMREAHVRAI